MIAPRGPGGTEVVALDVLLGLPISPVSIASDALNI